MMARRLIVGFVAGALATVVFHQAMILLLHYAGQTPNFPWSMRPTGPLGVPAIVNSMFWGGLWGVAYMAVARFIPIGADLLRGAVYGLIGPFLLGNGVLVPLFKGGAYFWGGDVKRMVLGALIGAGFGLGLAVFLRVLARR
jgi:hypothetical protein